MYILFCQDPLQPNQIDQDFADQYNAAKENGFMVLLFDFETLTREQNPSLATKNIPQSEKRVTLIYRGWMLTLAHYTMLYNHLLTKNYQLINTPQEYQNCHYLPNSLPFIEKKTPKTVFEKFENPNSIQKLIEKAKIFGQNPVIIKDYVKSEKHHWETACFVPDASDTEKLKESIKNLINLRDKYLNEGLVIRAFVELNELTTHSKSGMPLKEEYRLFFCNKKLIGIYDYWEEGAYHLNNIDTTLLEEIAKQIPSNFFSMDIARQKNGELIIIELGDGQVTGIPEKTNKNVFYKQLNIFLFKE